MALIKGFNVINNLKGKIGNIVVQKGVYGESVVRAYKSEVKNPKTIAQSNQRMKAAPTQYARRAMKNIIDHSFEGVAYGQKSLNHFVSLAMKGNAAPAQQKGDMRFIPGKYQISAGSLAPISADLSNPTRFILSSLAAQGAANTVAQLSSLLIAQNTQILEGDRITICYVLKQIVDGRDFYEFKYDRFNVNTTDVTTLPSVGFKADENKLLFVPWANSEDREIASACFILSRQSGTNWMRSSATMAVSSYIEEQYFSPSAIENAIASYTAVAKGVYSDWYMNQGEVNILRFVANTPWGMDTLGAEITTENNTKYPNGTNLASAIIVENGVQKLAVFEISDGDGADTLATPDGKPIVYTDNQVEGVQPVFNTSVVKATGYYTILKWSDDYLGKF